MPLPRKRGSILFTDSHNHTIEFSADASMTLDELVSAASGKGIPAVVVTEHYEKDFPHKIEKPLIFDIDAYFVMMSEKQTMLPEGFTLYTGIELGYQKHLPAFYDALVKSYPFDSVILSNHLIDGKDPFFFRDCYKVPKEEVYARYIEELAEMIESSDDFDIVGHYDYIARYAPYPDPTIHYDLCPEAFDRFLTAVVRKNKSLEINTRSIYKFHTLGIADRWPDQAILKRYLELGGTRVSLGSDSHDPSTIGIYFDETAALLKDFGFDSICSYVNRKEIRQPISR